MKNFDIRTPLRGETLFEVLVSIALLAILATGLFALLSSQIVGLGRGETETMGLSLAEEGLFAVRSIRDASWATVTTGTHGLALSGYGAWSFSGAEDVTDNLFHRTVTVTEVSETQKTVISKVTWQADNNKPRTIELSTTLTDWRNALPIQVWGDWRYPILGGSVDLGAGNAGMGLTVKNKMIYAAARASDSKKPDFYVVNAMDSYHPFIAGSLDTGSGLIDVAVTGTVAYAITSSQTDKLEVINVTNSASPVLLSKITPTGGILAHPKSIALNKKFLFVGGKTDNLGEFAVFDITDPLNPTFKSSLRLGADVNGMVVYGERVYLATSLNDGELVVVGVNAAGQASVVKKVDVVGTGDGNDVYVDSKLKLAYVARNAEGATNNPELAIYDVKDADNPVSWSSINSTTGFSRVVESGKLSFIASQNANLEFQVFDMRNINNPSFMSGVNFPQDAVDLALEDNIVYTAVRSNDAIKIITAQ